MKIICYGVNLYGKFISDVIGDTDIKLEVIVLSPFENYLWEGNERSDLIKNIKKMASAKNVDVYLSSILPTIRASLICDSSDKPLFCTIQPYYMYNDGYVLKGADYSPSIVVDESDKWLLQKMQESFLSEFSRLKFDKKAETVASVQNAENGCLIKDSQS